MAFARLRPSHCFYNQWFMPDFQPTRTHRTRLMQIWRSAGWPCKDAIEIDLLAARLVAQHTTREGHEVLRLTDAGITLLAQARQRGLRALSAHDRLAQRFAEHLLGAFAARRAGSARGPGRRGARHRGGRRTHALGR